MEILQGLVLAEKDFDEKLSLSARRRWWERFLNVTVQGGWTDQMKGYELKTKMSPAVRNWYGQLSNIRLSKEFKREYCKSRRFIKNLTDVTLKTTLQSQRFRKVSDLEYVLKQQDELNPSRVHSGRGAQPRDFRADNIARNGPRMNRPNRAYVAQDDEAQGSDTQVTFEDDERADLAALSTGDTDRRMVGLLWFVTVVRGMDIQRKGVRRKHA
ncbi:Hypothetical protein PHPALM_13472 [Phytophthora palmivora]|uniref:Uncharacterized protein n=1 Tax=Phytophthora palmivora TaxID=4796 RepID=A0A2P4XX53_9STRA|nr:Hypothetical protein PHPALM_13472 [Phytophthora palmivora]